MELKLDYIYQGNTLEVLKTFPIDGIVLDPFIGSGTTAVVAKEQNKHYIGIELNPEYIKIANNRINNQ